jgi:carbamate kinase
MHHGLMHDIHNCRWRCANWGSNPRRSLKLLYPIGTYQIRRAVQNRKGYSDPNISALVSFVSNEGHSAQQTLDAHSACSQRR